MVYNYVADNIRFYKGQTFAEPLRRTKDYRGKCPETDGSILLRDTTTLRAGRSSKFPNPSRYCSTTSVYINNWNMMAHFSDYQTRQ